MESGKIPVYRSSREEKKSQFLVDVGKMYAFTPDEMIPDIRATAYSNVAYITCTNRDVFIDFLEMPGMKKDGKMMVPGTRVYMSHAAAQKLAETLTRILEGSYQRGEMESYTPLPVKTPAGKKEKKKSS